MIRRTCWTKSSIEVGAPLTGSPLSAVGAANATPGTPDEGGGTTLALDDEDVVVVADVVVVVLFHCQRFTALYRSPLREQDPSMLGGENQADITYEVVVLVVA